MPADPHRDRLLSRDERPAGPWFIVWLGVRS
jgi:hypothetical protein